MNKPFAGNHHRCGAGPVRPVLSIVSKAGLSNTRAEYAPIGGAA